ncbi:MAG TPA: hypothetical protein VGO59_09790 [Verrucomicrobiae bacterium]
MKNTQYKFYSIFSRKHRRGCWMAVLPALAVALAFAGPLRAGNIYVPNFSFESPAAPQVLPFAINLIDEWQETLQPASYNPAGNFDTPWSYLVGVFYNLDYPGEFIDNIDGAQGAFLQNFPAVGILQDENSAGITSSAPDHLFNAAFKPGKGYTLTVGLTSSSAEPLTEGSTLQMSLYYRDSNSNMVTVAASTVTFDTNVFTNLTHLTDFTVALPKVQASDAWAGQNIGIQLICTTPTNLAAGYWDVDNVRLLESLYVPNYSFESPVVPEEFPYATNLIAEWQETPQPSDYYPSNNYDTPWSDLVGAFYNANTLPSYIGNTDGIQAALMSALPGVGLLQDYNSIGITGSSPDHAFNAVFNPGKAYTLTFALTSSLFEPLTQGSTLLLGLYYRDPSNNIDIVGSRVVTFDTNVFTNLTEFADFQVQVPAVQPNAPWAGQNIGILALCTPAANLVGGYWDLDNVRLVETTPLSLVSPTLSGSQIQFTVQSEPGAVCEILASGSLNVPVTNWTSIGTITNTTGRMTFAEPAENPQGFYIARPVP